MSDSASDNNSEHDINSEHDNSEHDSSDSDQEQQDYYVGFQNGNERGDYLLTKLRKWAIEGGTLSMSKLDSLLPILHPLHPDH